MARPLRGGGGLKGQPLRKKELLFEFFFILLPFKIKNYLTLNNFNQNMDILR